MNAEYVSKLFIEQYYGALQKNRAALLAFYSEASQMTYSGTKFTGLKEIQEKIESFSFQTIEFQNINSDVQEGPVQGSLMIFVSGQLRMDFQE
jgi:hypothetical protein